MCRSLTEWETLTVSMELFSLLGIQYVLIEKLFIVVQANESQRGRCRCTSHTPLTLGVMSNYPCPPIGKTSLQNVGLLHRVKPHNDIHQHPSTTWLQTLHKFTLHYCIHVAHGASATSHANCRAPFTTVYM